MHSPKGADRNVRTAAAADFRADHPGWGITGSGQDDVTGANVLFDAPRAVSALGGHHDQIASHLEIEVGVSWRSAPVLTSSAMRF
jgi:hypothetical protein